MAKRPAKPVEPVILPRMQEIVNRMAKLARLQAVVDDYDTTLKEAKELINAEIAENGDKEAFKDFGITFTSRTTVYYEEAEANQWAAKHPEYLGLNKTKFEKDARDGVLSFPDYEVSKSASVSYTPKNNRYRLV